MRVYKCEDLIKVKDAPVGLFLIEDHNELICISEYRSGPGTSMEDKAKYTRDAYIVRSGENYCGGDDLLGYSIVIE